MPRTFSPEQEAKLRRYCEAYGLPDAIAIIKGQALMLDAVMDALDTERELVAELTAQQAKSTRRCDYHSDLFGSAPTDQPVPKCMNNVYYDGSLVFCHLSYGHVGAHKYERPRS